MNGELFVAFFSLVFFGAIYAFFAICLQTIAKKTDTENPWMAWVPVMNLILLLTVAKKPMWWIVLFLIPVVNVVAAVLIMMSVAERREKPSWVGALVVIPLFGTLVIPYLAFSS